ncbi:MAG: urea carboxylase [bacterium]|nr:urea carboxylase [bacterium]
MFEKVLIANRGEIAVRIQRSLKKLGVASVALYSPADREARHVLDADEAIALPGDAAAESYLDVAAVLAAARSVLPKGNSSGSSPILGVHPGYGFLSENAAFAEACAQDNIAFIGPTPAQLRDFGLKHTARELALKSEVPLLPGSGLLADIDEARREAERVGFPVMLKSTAGGGGIGMRLCANPAELEREFQTVRDLGRRNFADDGIYIERFVERARHVEVQIFGDGAGRVVALGERDCSVQRRNQKVIEETPAPGLSPELRADLYAAAERLGAAVDYRSAGTVEFVYDEAASEFYFLEVNTRLQVEHGITENVTGVDLVEWMIRLAAGESDFLDEWSAKREADPERAYSIQARVYAEDPAKNFQPGSGVLNHVEFPRDGLVNARVDAWIESGSVVSPYYDPLLAKVMVTGPSREAVLDRLERALAETRIYGIETNQEFLRAIIAGEDFRGGRVWTRMLDDFEYESRSMEVLAPGAQTSVQDYPGRVGYWDVGVPPSGPMDALAFRLGNALLKNEPSAAGLEMTVSGATLRFRQATCFCLTGANMRARLIPPDASGRASNAPGASGAAGDESAGEAVPYWTVIQAPAGSVLKIGAVLEGHGGSRSYLLVKNGLDVPAYLGSRATFALGEFGGHAGRNLSTGDVLRINQDSAADSVDSLSATNIRLERELVPEYPVDAPVQIGVLYGPHAAPEFFTPEFIEIFFSTDWEVHYNSARTGVRLIGPKPGWARPDGGEAGLHPSNIHDNAYAVGAIDFTGDMPIILGPDGPSLGGFVCPATIVQAELWKIGQLRPGDRVRFVRISRDEASDLERRQERELARAPENETIEVSASRSAPTAAKNFARPTAAPEAGAAASGNHHDHSEAVLYARDAGEHPTGVVIRQAGDRYLLVEYGPIVLDLNLRLRVHALMQWLRSHPEEIRGVLDLTPGIRSLQIHFDSLVTDAAALVEELRRAEAELADVSNLEIESRVVHLPLSWNDASTVLATEKYMQSVWKDAPWCPDNLEFIRRINGLDDIEAVRKIVFDASYMVMGLGDVYLGAPVATPLDPRHRLVTTKYNPARTWTPQNAVGIGGAYLCVYGMEGPGGYQFVGRTCQVWNTYRRTREFAAGHPYLLRFFDEIRFFPVAPEELMDFRADFLTGRVSLRIDAARFRAAEYNRFLADNESDIAAFKHRQQAAFEAERERWRDLPPPPAPGESSPESGAGPETASELPAHIAAVNSPMHGNVWKLLAAPGTHIRAGEDVLILEAMKMEVAVQAPCDGVVAEVLCGEGSPAKPGQRLVLIDTREAKH